MVSSWPRRDCWPRWDAANEANHISYEEAPYEANDAAPLVHLILRDLITDLTMLLFVLVKLPADSTSVAGPVDE